MKRLLSICCLAMFVVTTQAAAQNQLTVNQWVQPVNDGVLKGRIVVPAAQGTSKSVENASVALLGSDGEVLRSDVKTNAKGEFEIQGVEPGVYALTARADFVFAACAMHVLDSDIVGEREFPAVAEVSAANVDFTTVKTAMIRYMPPQVETDFSIENAQLDGLGTLITSDTTNQVARYQGGMKGRIHAAGANGSTLNTAQLTNIFMMKDGAEVARTITDEEGNFFVKDLPAGNYSLLAVGPQGLGLVGFELTNDEPTTAQVTTNGQRLVQSGCCCCQEFSMQVAPPEVMNVVQEPVYSAPVDTRLRWRWIHPRWDRSIGRRRCGWRRIHRWWICRRWRVCCRWWRRRRWTVRRWRRPWWSRTPCSARWWFGCCNRRRRKHCKH